MRRGFILIDHKQKMIKTLFILKKRPVILHTITGEEEEFDFDKWVSLKKIKIKSNGQLML